MTLEQAMLESLEGTVTAYVGAPYGSVTRVSTAKPVPVGNSTSAPETEPVARHRASILTLRPLVGDDLKISLEVIKAAVSAYFDVPVYEIISPRRENRLVNCRMVYYWLARELTLASFPMIGRHCGNRDHSTVMNGIHTIKRFWPRYETAIKALKGELKP